jgi:hypothetical protein
MSITFSKGRETWAVGCWNLFPNADLLCDAVQVLASCVCNQPDKVAFFEVQ